MIKKNILTGNGKEFSVISKTIPLNGNKIKQSLDIYEYQNIGSSRIIYDDFLIFLFIERQRTYKGLNL